MGDFDVRHILVDPSSLADLLQASVISHMGCNLSGLESHLVQIQRSGDYLLGRHCATGPSRPNHSQRTIFDGTRFITLQCYLGATWLHYMKVIPSTYHQMVSFLTEDGQIDLYSSQLAARQCYQIAREVGTSQEGKPLLEPTNALDQ